MTDQEPARDPGSDRGQQGASRPPRWVKIFGIIGLVIVLLVIVLLLAGHGPSRHMGHPSAGHSTSLSGMIARHSR